jgi:hypothetical protein
MRGAIIFLVVFAIALLATLAYTGIPPGRALYNLLNVPDTNYLVANTVPATALAISILNGVVYGIIAWLIFTLVTMIGKKREKPQNVRQVVNVNVSEKKEDTPPPPETIT